VTGRVIHFEVPADDVARAQTFYREAFGWQITSMPEMNYSLIVTTEVDEQGGPKEPGAVNGGMMTRSGEFTSPVITIEADDIDQALSTVERLGGKTVMPRTPVADMGFTAYFRDTEGNVIGLWQNAG
jgi:uncharacterized protein